jgi:predicted tellurium resistance membrane protein TerC
MFEQLANPEIWISLLSLSMLEVVLGIDNIVFISILSSKLPIDQQKNARRAGLFIGLLVRMILLGFISIILKLDTVLFTVFNIGLSGKDLIILVGGLFLLYQSTKEMHHKLEGESGDTSRQIRNVTMSGVIVQMFILNFVFSIDSVVTAIGMAKEVWVMMSAVIISMVVMLVAAEPISDFVNKHPTIKILALSFLLLIGFSLVAEAFHVHIPKGYVYFAMAFSFMVDILQLRLNKTNQKVVHLHEHYNEKDEKKEKEML